MCTSPPRSKTNDHFIISKSEIVLHRVLGDGRCFFRCIVVANSNPDEVEMFEQKKSDKLRASVVTLIENEKLDLQEKTKCLPFILDSEVGKHYPSLQNRIAKMRKPSEYAGFLEILGAACLIKRQIWIYFDHGEFFKLHAKLPSRGFESSSPIRLLNVMDTKTQSGHFDLMIFPEKMSEERIASDNDFENDVKIIDLLNNVSQISEDITTISTDNSLHFSESHERDSTFESCFNCDCEVSNEESKNDDGVFVEETEVNDGPDGSVNNSIIDDDAEKHTVTISRGPDCWTSTQLLEKQKEYPWLIVNNKQIGCNICQEVSALGPESAVGVHISSEWAKSCVSEYGDTRKKQLLSLRKKIHDHKSSTAHIACTRILQTARKKTIETCNTQQLEGQHKSTCKIFRTAYKIAKNGRPYLDMSSDIELQTLNGVDLGRTLHSRFSCTNIIDHIANEMRSSLTEEIVKSGVKFSILIDESTSISRKTVLIIHIRTCLSQSACPITIFFDIVELKSTRAGDIFHALLTRLIKIGFTEEVLQNSLICCATDGASVMLGKKSGVATLLLEKFPNVVIWHCSNHRLELAVHDSVVEVAGVNNFQCFFDKLYSLYHASPKNQRELDECCSELGLQCRAIGRVLNTRWAASSFRTVNAVWKLYPALCQHLTEASVDPLRDSKEKATYNGLLKKITSETFVKNLGTMMDALNEMANTSLDLQKKDMTLPKAHGLLSREIRVLKSMATTPGKYYKEACSSSTSLSFHGVELHKGKHKSEVLIHYQQLMTSLANNFSNRMLTTRSSHVSTRSDTTSTIQFQAEYDGLINGINCLYPENWPENIDVRIIII